MRYTKILRLLLISSIALSVGIRAETNQPLMEKSRSGIPLGVPFDQSMCAMDGVAVDGLDLVSYRQPGGPVPGNPEFSMEFNGSTYLFANESNLDTFRANAERYLPTYAGFCAITLALGRVTCPEYSNFKIEDDRLLVFEITGFTNGRILWDSSPEEFRNKADANFKILRD